MTLWSLRTAVTPDTVQKLMEESPFITTLVLLLDLAHH